MKSGTSTPKTPSTPASPPPAPSSERSDSGIQHSGIEDENTTDWIPEIPFENLHRTLSNDVDEDDTVSYKQKYDSTDPRYKKRGSTHVSTIEQVDDIIDHSIEIESNKRMRNANVNPWTLRFIDRDMEYQFSQLREDMFKSNMMCCFIIWLFIVVCQAIITPLRNFVIASLVVTTFILASTSVLVMAEEFEQLPEFLRRTSTTLVHKRKRRTAFICGVIILMSLTSSLTLINIENDEPVDIRSMRSGSQQRLGSGQSDVNDQGNFSLVFNMKLEATFNNNLTVLFANRTNCSEGCIKNVLGNIDINGIIEDAENITKLANKTSTIVKSLNQKLSNLTSSLFTQTEALKQLKSILPRSKRGISATVTTTPHSSNANNSTTNDVNSTSSIVTTTASPGPPEFDCKHPEYIVYTWVLCLIALATALKLYYLIKLLLAFVMVAVYANLIILPSNIFNERGSPITVPELFIPLSAQMFTLLVVFFLMVAYHARLVEVTSRLDFLWKQQAERELNDMEETRHNNTQLLKNILPDHVAQHFLSSDRNSEELYAQCRQEVGVMFGSIPNFTDFYSEDINKGVECIRLLNEIIADFDELLDEERFSTIEKIKTVSATATYMAASGLNPTHKDCRNTDGPEHLCALVDFAMLMRHKLDAINKDSFNNFKLRIGIACGPLVCGVIGARKPVFDIWGDTVNLASRMDSTGVIGDIQVPKETAQILGMRGYELKKRGIIDVKGKGQMETYFVVGRQMKKPPSFQRQPSHYSSLAAVVYAVAQTRRKHTGNTPGSAVFGRARTQQKNESGKKIINYSSMRVTHKPFGYPVRRNTTRANQKHMHARSQPNMRQLSGSGIYLENMKSMKSIDRDTTSNTLNRMAVSQSAPHTPVSASNHEGPIFKSVPRLLSEPIVNRSKSCSPCTKTSRLERNISILADRKTEVCTNDLNDSFKVKPAGVVPVHSPKHLNKKESKFSLKSPMIRRETKIQLENSINREKLNKVHSLDGTHV